MSKIACILPDQALTEQARIVIHEQNQDIRFGVALMEEAVEVAKDFSRDGYEVIISRGRTATVIKEAYPDLSIVEIPFTVLDLLQTIEKAKFHGNYIAVVAFAPMILGLEHLGSMLSASIRFFPLEKEDQVDAKVLEAIKENVDIVVGGVITGKTAQKHGIPFALIENSPESMRHAVVEAKNIALARQQEKAKANFFKAVLDYAYDGVISVNAKGQITIFNPVAERVTQINASVAIGRHIREVWPELEMEKILQSCKEDLGQLLTVNNEKVVCNKVPICVHEKVVGAIINFQDVTKLQQMEARVRRRLFDTGHVATHRFNDIIGTSKQIQKSISLAQNYARTDSAILIQGETGTGKEVFAQSIHNDSSRSNGPFVALNCAALPAQILESELFGYVGGAFTGASQKGKAGLFEIAHGGTLFLDEIAEMEYATQGKLLRVLQEKKVMRLGSDRVTPVDVRIIAATNKPLKSLVNDNKFRADLYYRLNVLRLRLYPLRDRKEDVIHLANYFLNNHTSIINKPANFTQKALDELTRYSWPGNIREVQNIIERILATLNSSKITQEMVQQHLEDQHEGEIYSRIIQDEMDEIREALLITRGNHTEAAKILGMSRSTLWRKLKKSTNSP